MDLAGLVFEILTSEIVSLKWKMYKTRPKFSNLFDKNF